MREKYIIKLVITEIKGLQRYTLAKDLGNQPWNLFWLKLIIINLLPFVQVCGMLPSNAFLRKSNMSRESPKLCKHWGSEPLKLLFDKSRTWGELLLQINSGIFSVNEFFDTRYSNVEKDGIGSDPWSLLKVRSKMIRRVQGRRIGCWPRLVWKFSEMSITSKFSLLMFQNHSGTWPWMLLVPRSSHTSSSWFARKSGNLLKSHK